MRRDGAMCIGHSPDKMLQFRIAAYADVHRYRVGVNYESLPVNHPARSTPTIATASCDFDGNGGRSVN